MSQFVQINGDYTIKSKEGGTITFDTGPGVGNTRVTGNLIVDGETLTVSATNLNVEDNIITLNFGESGTSFPGVSLGYSGIEIDRGKTKGSGLDNAAMVYDEDSDAWIFVHGTIADGYGFGDSNIRVRRILTNSDTDSGDLTLIGSGIGVVKVIGTTTGGVGRPNAYETRVTDPDDIPNKAYVDNAIQNNPTRQIRHDDSRIMITDANESDLNWEGFVVEETEIDIVVNGVSNSKFYPNRALIQDLEITGTEIYTADTNNNIVIRTSGTGRLQTNYAFELEKINVVPASVSTSNILYSADPGVGATGIYFVNSQRNGELINKNKALVFSMIF